MIYGHRRADNAIEANVREHTHSADILYICIYATIVKCKQHAQHMHSSYGLHETHKDFETNGHLTGRVLPFMAMLALI